jgi:hypothetical protein
LLLAVATVAGLAAAPNEDEPVTYRFTDADAILDRRPAAAFSMMYGCTGLEARRASAAEWPIWLKCAGQVGMSVREVQH